MGGDHARRRTPRAAAGAGSATPTPTIGFGGPAYPRGYMRLAEGVAGADPDEAREAFQLDPVLDVHRGVP